jgi:hypothetical protein
MAEFDSLGEVTKPWKSVFLQLPFMFNLSHARQPAVKIPRLYSITRATHSRYISEIMGSAGPARLYVPLREEGCTSCIPNDLEVASCMISGEYDNEASNGWL